MDPSKADAILEQLKDIGISGWRLLRFLDNGKSAAVYEAEKEGRRAAIKIFDTDLVAKYGDEALLERITREGALVGHDHPNLVKMLDHGVDSELGYRFLVMELLSGRSLAARLAEVPAGAIPTLVEQLASAAKFLEGLGFAHRDIKPANIMVSDDFRHLTLLDLGVLKPIGESGLTDPGSNQLFVGTNQYASPEFALRREEDTPEGWRAISFYQVGAVLHDMIMRRPIFAEHVGVPARLAEAIQREVPNIVGDDVPPYLVRLARHCLVKSPLTRLELVHWKDFKEPPPEPTRSAELTRMIRDRVAAAEVQYEETSRYTIGSPDGEPLLLHEATNLLKDILNGIGREDPPLPRRMVYAVNDAAEIRCLFEPSEEHALPEGISFRFTIDTTDVASKIVRVSAASAASQTFAADEELNVIYHGSCELTPMEEALLVFALSKVDQAQRREG